MESYSAYLKNPSRYSAKKIAKPVNFYCQAPTAQRVCVVGDFNNWQPEATPMQRQFDGTWFVQLQLSHGHHQYLFVVDGKPTLDPRAHGTGRNARHEKVSLVAVS